MTHIGISWAVAGWHNRTHKKIAVHRDMLIYISLGLAMKGYESFLGSTQVFPVLWRAFVRHYRLWGLPNILANFEYSFWSPLSYFESPPGFFFSRIFKLFENFLGDILTGIWINRQKRDMPLHRLWLHTCRIAELSPVGTAAPKEDQEWRREERREKRVCRGWGGNWNQMIILFLVDTR